jgi:hypothetical protein
MKTVRRFPSPQIRARLRVARPYTRDLAEPRVDAAAALDAESRRLWIVAENERRQTLLSMEEAAVYLRYDGPNAANSVYVFLRTHKVTLEKRGNRVLVRVGALDDLLKTGQSGFVERALLMGKRG